MTTQRSPMEPFDQDEEAVADYRQQARVFLSKTRQYLAEGDLHQASEKGWGAADWMAKAVAEAQGWEYRRHDQFFQVMYDAANLSGDRRLNAFRRTANELHGFYYTRRRFLHADAIGDDLDEMETLLDVLEPMTEPGEWAPPSIG